MDKIEIVWTIEDIASIAFEMGLCLTLEEASRILMSVKKNHDASVGVNWTVLETHIAESGLGKPLAEGEVGNYDDL